MAPKAQVPDYTNTSLVRLQRRRRESKAALLDSWGVPPAPPPPGAVEPQALAASSSSHMEPAPGPQPDVGTVITTPLEELHGMRYAMMQTLGFAPTRYCHIIAGRPVVVPHAKKKNMYTVEHITHDPDQLNFCTSLPFEMCSFSFLVCANCKFSLDSSRDSSVPCCSHPCQYHSVYSPRLPWAPFICLRRPTSDKHVMCYNPTHSIQYETRFACKGVMLC